MRALIFCAGEGRRLRPLTEFKPKPLIEIGGTAMAVRQMLALKRAGIREFVLNAAHCAEVLMNTLGDGSRWGVKIRYSVEGLTSAEALETRGGIVRALPLLSEGDSKAFIAVAGDIVSDYDYVNLVERARRLSPAGDLAHLVMVENPSFHRAGDFGLRSGRIVDRAAASREEIFTYSSLAAFHSSLFSQVEPGRAKLFPWMLDFVRANRVSGELFRGRWVNVGTAEELARAEEIFGAQP